MNVFLPEMLCVVAENGEFKGFAKDVYLSVPWVPEIYFFQLLLAVYAVMFIVMFRRPTHRERH